MWWMVARKRVAGKVVWVRQGKARVEISQHRYTIPQESVRVGPLRKGDWAEVQFDAKGGVRQARPLARPHVCKRWTWTSRSSKRITLRCTRCLTKKERDLTGEEIQKLTEVGMLPLMGEFDREKHIHTVWWSFRDRFMTEDGWKLTGLDLMNRVEEWAREHPNDVQIVGCDDSFHSSSWLVLIEHKTEAWYMGTSVVFIPQCSGEYPIQLFLYPSHRDQLIEALVGIKKRSKPVLARERKAKREQSRFMSQVFGKG